MVFKQSDCGKESRHCPQHGDRLYNALKHLTTLHQVGKCVKLHATGSFENRENTWLSTRHQIRPIIHNISPYLIVQIVARNQVKMKRDVFTKYGNTLWISLMPKAVVQNIFFIEGWRRHRCTRNPWGVPLTPLVVCCSSNAPLHKWKQPC